MKKLLSLALVLTMLFTIISIPSVSAAVVTDDTADAEGFKAVYMYGFESGTAPTGGAMNFWTNGSTSATDGTTSLGKLNGLQSVTTYSAAGVAKPVSFTGDTFGDKVLKFDYTKNGAAFTTSNQEAIARLGQIKNQVTLESGATYRLSFWIYIDSIKNAAGETLTKATMNDAYFCVGGSGNAQAAAYGTIESGSAGTRYLKTGTWHKIGMTFTANDTLVSQVASNGWGVRWGFGKGATPVGYLDNLQLEKLDTRTRVVEPNYFYYEGFDSFNVGLAVSKQPYYSAYFTPNYPKPADAATTPTWTTRGKFVPFGSGGPSFGIMNLENAVSGGTVLRNKLDTAAASGGNYITDIFHGDFTSADIGRKFLISVKVYPEMSGSTVTDATSDGPTFAFGLGGPDGISNGKYGHKYRSYSRGVAYINNSNEKTKWDTWNEISGVFTVTAEDVMQTSVNDADVATKNAYKGTTSIRVAQAGTILTNEYFMDDFIVRELKKYTISATSSDTAMGTVTGGGEVWENDSATLVATANEGYSFSGWYNGDTLVSSEASFTVANPTANASYVAKFEKERNVEYTNEVYYFNFESGDKGSTNAWYKSYPDAKNVTTNGTVGTISWDTAKAAGIEMPGEIEEFGKQLYRTNFVNAEVGAELAGRFNSWEAKATDSKFVAGQAYRLTMWVNPASVQLRKNETAEPATVAFQMKLEHSSTSVSGLGMKEVSVNVGQWNKVVWDFVATDKMAGEVIPGMYFRFGGSKNNTTDDPNNGKYTIVNCAYYDNIRIVPVNEWQLGDDAVPTGWVARGGAKGLDAEFHGDTVYNKSIMHFETYETLGVERPSAKSGDKAFVFDVTRPNVKEKDYNPKEGSTFWPEGGEKMSFEDALAIYSSYETLTSDLAGRFNSIVPANTLTLGKSYKIGLKVYIAEKRNLKAEGCPVVEGDTNVWIAGTHTGTAPVGDGKQTSKIVPFGEWTEISYTFKATEKGVGIAPSLRFDVASSDLTKFPTLVYVDDVIVELTHVDDITLEISEDDTEVTAIASVNDIKAGDALTVTVIIAAYDADGKLVSVALSTENGESLAVNGTATAKYTKADGIAKYVAYAWDNLTNIRPYVVPVVLGE